MDSYKFVPFGLRVKAEFLKAGKRSKRIEEIGGVNRCMLKKEKKQMAGICEGCRYGGKIVGYYSTSDSDKICRFCTTRG